MIITISGTPGSGKSTVAKLLVKKLGLKHYSTGDFMRDMAKSKGMTLEELGDAAKKDPSIDKELDERQIRLGKEEDNFIIDARLGFHFIPHSIKVFLDVDMKEGAKRILKDALGGLRQEEQAKNIQDIIEKIEKRKKSEIERYKKYYSLNPHDKSNYDLVIDSTHITAEQVAERILNSIKSKKTL